MNEANPNLCEAASAATAAILAKASQSHGAAPPRTPPGAPTAEDAAPPREPRVPILDRRPLRSVHPDEVDALCRDTRVRHHAQGADRGDRRATPVPLTLHRQLSTRDALVATQQRVADAIGVLHSVLPMTDRVSWLDHALSGTTELLQEALALHGVVVRVLDEEHLHQQQQQQRDAAPPQ